MAASLPERDPGTLLASAVRRRIVDALAGLPRLAVDGETTREVGLTAAELGEIVGMHPTTIRFHVDQLVAAGILTSHFVRRGGAGRPSKKYAVVDQDDTLARQAEVEGPYQVLAALLASALAPDGGESLTPQEAGVAWMRERRRPGEPPAAAASRGEWLGKVGTVVDVLGEWGYSPDLEVGGQDGAVALTLRDCPFLPLARVHPGVVCGVHEGLLQGALEGVGEADAGVVLQPFVTPTSCLAHLTRPKDGTAQTHPYPSEESSDD